MRLDRLLALTMLLANNRRVTAPELAKRFEVSVRTIYRDIDSINQAGIPVVTQRGAGGGIGLMAGYQMDRGILTTGEIFSVLATLEDITAVTGDQVINNALDKLKGLLSDQQIEQLRPQGRQICLDLAPWTGSRDERSILKELRRACAGCHPVTFSYTSSRGETIRRTVEPVMTILRKDAWYLYAFCRLRQEYRVFRLSRITDAQIENEVFPRHAVNASLRPWDSPWESEADLLDLVIRFAPVTRARVMDEFEPEQILSDEQGNLLVTCRYPAGEWLCSLVLSFGAQAEVLAPASLRNEIRERAAETLAIYQSEHDNPLS